MTEEWGSLPPMHLLPGESLEPEKKGHLTGVKTGAVGRTIVLRQETSEETSTTPNSFILV